MDIHPVGRRQGELMYEICFIVLPEAFSSLNQVLADRPFSGYLSSYKTPFRCQIDLLLGSIGMGDRQNNMYAFQHHNIAVQLGV